MPEATVRTSSAGVADVQLATDSSFHGSIQGSFQGYFHGYAVVGLLAVIGVLFVAVAFTAGRLLRPVVPTPEKLLTYECGVDPVGEGWAHTQVRYYVYAFLYVIFAVDSIFLFPWATVFAAPGFGGATLVEMFIFLGFLAVGLLYAWKKGVLEWT
ncbi:NADH-quinone oxidoreductase subunit A [Streptomyces sp. UNOC14_S4]|uniref:NADH-quinone oxidoreductase subunit A n=1 Tax=Streptomyces sp. UNOC14_S4 TaxID=2872340 RepID=UPI001E475EF9|nr:NADH-quinone oxidoreductase subunit A [Streptomyces sp. UNOC14_S4]